MQQLSQTLVDVVANAFKGKKREKFLASVEVINKSLAQGGWVLRGRVASQTGFYQGLRKISDRFYSDGLFELSMCVQYGDAAARGRGIENVTVTDEIIGTVCPKLDVATVRAWIALCVEVYAARKLLDISRPVPVITAIGLSPRVTQTLTECGLDLDLPSIKPAKIDFYLRHQKDEKTLELMYDKHGEPVMERVYFVAWTAGIKHNRSRFASGGHCHACGKYIPSGLFVAIEATCKKQGLISMWLGCDCARSIFGIKDVGVDQDAQPPA